MPATVISFLGLVPNMRPALRGGFRVSGLFPSRDNRANTKAAAKRGLRYKILLEARLSARLAAVGGRSDRQIGRIVYLRLSISGAYIFYQVTYFAERVKHAPACRQRVNMRRVFPSSPRSG